MENRNQIPSNLQPVQDSSKKRKRNLDQENSLVFASRIPLKEPSPDQQNSSYPQSNKNSKGHHGQFSKGSTNPRWNSKPPQHAKPPPHDAENPETIKRTAAALLQQRKTLPIWSHISEIRGALRKQDVLVLVGETGSGKSTQLPQFLLDESWCRRRSVPISGEYLDSGGKSKQNDLRKNGGVQSTSTTSNGLKSPANSSATATITTAVGGIIAITQPRRVAAVSLARRVAAEMGSPLGKQSATSKVGYHIRFDCSISPVTRIEYVTEGILLQQMVRDPYLKRYSAIVVDEVHERSTGVDLILGFLKRLVTHGFQGRGGVPLKVVVMSATLEVEKVKDFFEEAWTEPVPKELANGKSHCDANGEGVMRNSIGASDLKKNENGDDAYEEWNGFSSAEEEDAPISKRSTVSIDGRPVTIPARNGSDNINGHKVPNKANGSKGYNIANAFHGEKDAYKSGLAAHVATCYIEGRQFPVEVMYLKEPTEDFLDTALHLIFQLHVKEPLPGDMLIFVTGQDTVESLEKACKSYSTILPDQSPEVPDLLVVPLFAALPQAAQHKVFQRTPPKTRKIVITTNIAETSVTVSGVRIVIDCGKAKIKQYRSRIGLESLLVKPVSKSAAIQRQGRAGREAAGKCYRLYTEAGYLALEERNTPEILRCDLSHAILTMKARGIDDVINFPFLDKPPKESLQKALMQLFQLGALNDTGEISDLGQKIAKLPLSVPLGRVLLAASEGEVNCTSEVIDIISCLDVENIFPQVFNHDHKEQVEDARRDLMKREGDHLTLLATVHAYAREESDRKSWAKNHFVSHRAMQSVMEVRKQLRGWATSMGTLNPADADEASLSDLTTPILKAFLKGFATNTARLCPDGSYKTIIGNQAIAIHPASVLFGRKVEAIIYHEFVFTNRSYARGVSAVQMDWIAEVLT